MILTTRRPGTAIRTGAWHRALAVAVVSAAATVCLPTPAHADLYFTPYVALKFGGETTLLDLDFVAGSTETADKARKVTWGGSVLWLGTGILGFEGDIAFTPGYFQGDLQNVQASGVSTVLGNIVVAAPLTLTRESLRPYASAGWGLMRAVSEIETGVSYWRNLSAFNVGGGAVGMLSRRTGVRWDIRYLRGIGDAEGGGTLGGSAKLSYWRASMGVVIRTR